MKKIAALVALALLTAATDQPVFNGIYTFETRDRDPDTGRPICTETWSFDGAGKMIVTSGQEVVDKTYRAETNSDGSWLVTRRIKTNGLPDCMGERSDNADSTESRIYLLRFKDGGMMTCMPPGRTEDGTMFVSNESCYATLKPQKQP